MEPGAGGDQRRELRPNATGEEVEAIDDLKNLDGNRDTEARTSVPSQPRRTVKTMNPTRTRARSPALGRRGTHPWTAVIPCNLMLPLSDAADPC